MFLGDPVWSQEIDTKIPEWVPFIESQNGLS